MEIFKASTPVLPSFSHLVYRLPIESITGYVYGAVAQINPFLMLSIMAIRCVAETVIFRITNAIFGRNDLSAHKICVGVKCAVNVPFLILMREKNLMGRLPCAILGLGLLGVAIIHVNYIQAQEESP